MHKEITVEHPTLCTVQGAIVGAAAWLEWWRWEKGQWVWGAEKQPAALSSSMHLPTLSTGLETGRTCRAFNRTPKAAALWSQGPKLSALMSLLWGRRGRRWGEQDGSFVCLSEGNNDALGTAGVGGTRAELSSASHSGGSWSPHPLWASHSPRGGMIMPGLPMQLDCHRIDRESI